MERIVLVMLTALLLLNSDLADAQQPRKVPRIGFLFTGSKDQPHLESFRQGLANLGYVEGKNFAVEYRYAEGKLEALPALAAELVSLKLDVILTTTIPASRAVLQATNTIPVVAVGIGDPVVDGLVKSLARPGGNFTALSNSTGAGLWGKQLELLKEAVPRIYTVAMLWNIDAAQLANAALGDAKTTAKALGIQLRLFEIKSNADIDRAFDDLKERRVHGLLMTAGPVMTRNSKRLTVLAGKSRLPSMYNSRQFVEDGGLMSYGVNFSDLYRRAASYVDKILKGRQPADLPVEQPMKFELFVNLRTAEQIGVTIEPNVLVRADRVIR